MAFDFAKKYLRRQFMKKTVFFGLLVILLTLSLVGCGGEKTNITGVNGEIYDK